MASDCISRWGEARWGEARWGMVLDDVFITDGSTTPTGVLQKQVLLNGLGGTMTPTGTLDVPAVVRPPSHPGGYPGGTRDRGGGAMTRQTDTPHRTKEG